MKKQLLTSFLMFCVAAGFAQDKKQQDRTSILAMQGCYKVEFRYAEVFATDTAYEFPKRKYDWAYEWIVPIQSDENELSLQHLLTVNDTQVVKHWRQDWMYENTHSNYYWKDAQWNFKSWKKDEVKGQWSQRVSQVDDSPRYIGSGSWVHVDGKHYWVSESPAPLPRREKKAKRKDYNVLLRTNHQEITDYGWLHKQENRKMVRDDKGNMEMIAFETGWNTYTKVEENHCQPAIAYWEKTNKFWSVVRAEWELILQSEKDFKVQLMGKDGFLYATMFKLAKETGDWSEKKMHREVKKVLAEHVVYLNQEVGQVQP